MKKAILLFLFLLPFFSFSQTLDTALVRVEVDSLFEIIGQETRQRNFNQALDLLSQAEEKILVAFGKESRLYASCLDKKGRVFYSQGSYAAVEPLWLEALAIMEKALGKAHPTYAGSLNNLGVLYNNMGNYKKAEPIYQEALAIREKVLGKAHPSYAGSLINLASLYDIMGNYKRAEEFYLEAKEIFEVKLNNYNHPFYLKCLNNLGILYWEMGNYKKAEPLYQEALAITEEVLGKAHPSYAGSLINLGGLYNDMGNYERAEEVYLEAKEIFEVKLNNYNHPFYLNCINNLGILYHIMGNYKKAEPLYLEALAITEKVLGKAHPDYANRLISLGILYSGLGNYEKAESFYLESLAILDKVSGKAHPSYAGSLTNLGILYHFMGNYKRAEEVYLEAKEIFEVKLNNYNHPSYGNCLFSLGNLYRDMGKFAKAESFYLETNEITGTLLIQASRHLSEKELSAYIQTFTNRQNQLSSFAQIQAGLVGTSYDNALFYKGFLLNAARSAKRLAQADSTGYELWLRHKSYLRRLAVEYTKPIAGRRNVDTLEARANELEKELILTVAGYGEAIRQVEWQEVQAQLQPGDAAIEFVHYNFYDPNLTDSIIYAALVLRPGDEQPYFVPLFEQKKLTKLLAKSENSSSSTFIAKVYSQGITSKTKSDNEGLYELIWQPLDSLLSDTKTIYVSPSGLLHRINLGAVMVDSSHTFSDRYRLIMLGSTRHLAISSQQPAEGSSQSTDLSAVIYGGIHYDMDSTAIAQANASYTNIPSDQGALFFSLDAEDRSEAQRGRTWRYLSATAGEADKIGQMIQTKKGQVHILKGFAATEESFKRIGLNGPSPLVLHLATHGYFYPDPVQQAGAGTDWLDSTPAFKISDHPMIRSGLILAGGNHAWRTGKPLHPEMEDGILTAYEISQMNLDSTELVALSACETGLGDIEGNEGVYGLQRAFKIAGVKNIIMSLWSVPDQQTQEMMVAFYDHWLNEGRAIADAFRAAQREMREKYKEHYYWAAFVLIE